MWYFSTDWIHWMSFSLLWTLHNESQCGEVIKNISMKRETWWQLTCIITPCVWLCLFNSIKQKRWLQMCGPKETNRWHLVDFSSVWLSSVFIYLFVWAAGTTAAVLRACVCPGVDGSLTPGTSISSLLNTRWRTLPRRGERAPFFLFFFSFLELATRHATHSNGGLALLSLNLTGGMRLVGTQARGCPPLFMAHRSVSALIIIKPSLLQIKGWPARAALPLSHEAQEELTGLCARACPGKNFIILFT